MARTFEFCGVLYEASYGICIIYEIKDHMTTVHALVYYLDTGSSSEKTISGLWTTRADAEAAQTILCGGTRNPYINSCVRGTNNVVSWICEIPLNKALTWTLAVAGPGY